MREADILLRLIRLPAGKQDTVNGCRVYRRKDGRISVVIGGSRKIYRDAAQAARAVAAGRHAS